MQAILVFYVFLLCSSAYQNTPPKSAKVTSISSHDRIAVVFDDHKLFADSFSTWLERMGEFYFVYTFSIKEELIKFFFEKRNKIIYLFTDYYLTTGNSMSTLMDIKRLSPSTKIIFLSSLTNPLLIKKIMEIKPKAFLSKTMGMDDITSCLKKIDGGGLYISPFIEAILSSDTTASSIPFSIRELEVLEYFAKGISVVKTAEILNLSKHTIVAHRRKMMAKANCHTLIELLSYAKSVNLID